MDRTHPVPVTASEVVVDGDHVYALLGEGVQVGCERGHERLAFTRSHFGDSALMEHHSAEQLDVVMTLSDDAAGRFSDDREGFGEERVKVLTREVATFEFGCLVTQLRVKIGRASCRERVEMSVADAA